jgi:hypothetical protein
MRIVRVTVLALGLAFQVVEAIAATPWFWIGAAFFLAPLLLQLLFPRHLDRRVVLLGGAPV